MRVSRAVRIQVLAFTVIAVLGTSYVGASYAGLDKLVWDNGYVVKARFVSGGGVFTNSEVTYRGVAVGRVGQLRLTAAGMEADLRIQSGAPDIPADVEAVVANRSAVGEQYVDLRPRRPDGPKLGAGSVIQQENTKIPLKVEEVLTNMDAFTQSVPKEALRTVVDELYDATSGAGPNLEALLDNGISIIQATSQHMPQVTGLVTDANTVLRTQHQQSQAIKDFSVNAAKLAETMKNSDSDLRRLIPVVPSAANEVSGVVREAGPGTGVLLANLLTTAEVTAVRQNGIEQLLVMTPRAVSAGSAAVRGDGAHFGLALTFFDPLPCTRGYGGTPIRDGLDATPGSPLNMRASCTLPKGSESNVRGSQNVPRPK